MAAKIDEILRPIASVLPVDGTINILNPVIATGEFPTNLCAIKMLTELVTNQSEQITDAHVDNVMPNIAKVIMNYLNIYMKRLRKQDLALIWRTHGLWDLTNSVTNDTNAQTKETLRKLSLTLE